MGLMTKTVTSELVVHTHSRTEKKLDLWTKESLTKLTKHAIVELALELFGADLSMRLSKAKLVEKFLEQQEN